MTEDEVDTKIEEWHTGDSPLFLHEYLGWTWPEYRRWVETGALPEE